MHGDFSKWFGKVPKNQVGILAQEGRILLDADLNAGALIETRWQDLAARAAFGAHVAAIPADNLDAWKVIGASISQGTVHVSVLPGAAWADGLLVELDGVATKPVDVVATPLGPPLQDPPQDLGAAGTRDAVMLEVWRRSLNGYQSPGELVEAALGGPDTAERIETAYALRLYRMGSDDTCRTLDLNDKLANHGHLTVTIAPTTMTPGDCPVVQGGGYTGLEHDLYRVEIANTDTGAAMFKWSQWNGGLVGRGEYDAAAHTLVLRAGDQAITRSGLHACYVEALVFDPSAGHWRVAYGTSGTIDITGKIDLATTATFGAPPDASMIANPSDPNDKTWFVRVWNDLRSIADFPAGGAKELRDGIRLEFGGGSTGRFVPGDYWTFPVRAQMDNPATLLSDAPPFGVHHHRVPLAELHWNGSTATTIEDCRVPLHPITATDGCCTHSVGDGITSHGDFTTVQAAIDALPGTGGRVCVLPGTYTENVQVLYKYNVEIIGCGPRSRIVAKLPGDDAASGSPAIYVLDTSGIKIEKVYVEGVRGGIAILLEEDEGAGTSGGDTPVLPFLEDIRVADCEVVAAGGSGIEIRGGHRSELVHNHLRCDNQPSDWSLITVQTADARIAHNTVTVPTDKPDSYVALGGIWLRGGCTNIDVLDNHITGGAGHGIMLGHAEQSAINAAGGDHIAVFATKIKAGLRLGYVFNHDLLNAIDEDCVGCGPGVVTFPQPPNSSTPPWVAGDPLGDIRIRDNRIEHMGISGVGVIGFFPDSKFGVISIDRLAITGNVMAGNLTRGTADVEAGALSAFGYGAISLAEVSELTIDDNDLHDNGLREFGQVCGIFVQTGAGLQISRNRIVDNGPLRARENQLQPHGGVWLANVMPPLEGKAASGGRLAVSIHDNEIQTNTGPGLFIGGIGHYSIIANSITTRSSIGTVGKVAALNVVIANQSTARDLNLPSFHGLRDKRIELVEPAIKAISAGKTIAIKNLAEAEVAGAKISWRPGELAAAVYQPPPGSVMFANNHVLTYATDGRQQAAVQISSLADVTVSGNHFLTVDVADKQFHPTPVSIIGADTHVNNNRFADTVMFASVATWGVTNITAHNTADHCIIVTWQTSSVVGPNIERHTSYLCKLLNGTLGNAGINIGVIGP